jgi:2-hydroxychromene-2-carboxylate isomerase
MAGLDLFFFYGSTYTYLTVMRVETRAAAAGVTLRWRPFNVRAIMVEQQNIPFADKPVKAAYMWRDLERRAGRHGLGWAGAPPYPIDRELLANRVGQVAAEEGWCAGFTRSAYRAWFLEGRALGAAGTLEPILAELGQDPARVLAAARSEAAAERLERETDAARALGIFGSPTFAVGSEIFWGDDRLDDALDWARQSAAS